MNLLKYIIYTINLFTYNNLELRQLEREEIKNIN